MEEENQIDLSAVDIKKYRRLFYMYVVANAVCTGVCFFLAGRGFRLLDGFYPDTKLTLSILSVMVVFAFLHSGFTKRQLQKLKLMDGFEERETAYERLYRFRVFWFLFSSLVSCTLALLSGRTLFCYYAMFDIAVSLNYYPNLSLFRKELGQDDIIFY